MARVDTGYILLHICNPPDHGEERQKPHDYHTISKNGDYYGNYLSIVMYNGCVFKIAYSSATDPGMPFKMYSVESLCIFITSVLSPFLISVKHSGDDVYH